MDEKEIEIVKQKLRAAACTGLDLSPGDPLAGDALKAIESLENLLLRFYGQAQYTWNLYKS